VFLLFLALWGGLGGERGGEERRVDQDHHLVVREITRPTKQQQQTATNNKSKMAKIYTYKDHGLKSSKMTTHGVPGWILLSWSTLSCLL
jgi:hypothetical protein